MSKQIFLVSSSEEIILPYGSKIETLTSRDPKPVKILKYLHHMGINSILTNILEKNKIPENSLVVFFKESTLESNYVLNFCKKNKCDLLILKDKVKFDTNTSFDSKIIHSPNLNTYIEIYDRIIREIKDSL